MGAAPGRPAWRSGRAARAAILLIVLPLGAYVLYAILHDRLSEPPAAQAPPTVAPPGSEMKDFTFQQSDAGQLRYTLRAGRLVGTESGVVLLEQIRSFEINAPEGPIQVAADAGRLVLSEGKIAMINLSGAVTVEGPEGERLETPSAEFQAAKKSLKTASPSRFRARGVSGEGGSVHYWAETGAFEMSGPVRFVCEMGSLEGWTAHAGSLSVAGEGRPVVLTGGVRFTHPAPEGGEEWVSSERVEVGPSLPATRARFDGNVRGLLNGPAAQTAGGGAVSFSAATLELARDAPRSPANAVLRGGAVLSSGGADELAAPEITIAFDEGGRAETVSSRGGSLLTRRDAGGLRTLRAHEMTLRASASGFGGGDARGSVRIAGPSFTASAEEAAFAEDRVSLRGQRPWARGEGRTVIADRIDRNETSGLVVATGNVQARMEPRREGENGSRTTAGARGLPLFASNRPVQIECREATFDPSAGETRFRGGVRAWQDEMSLQASSLDLREENGGLARAWENVITRGVRSGEHGGRTPFWVSASEMLYEQARGLVQFRGGCTYSEAGSALRAETISLRLRRLPPPSEKPGSADDATDRIEAVEGEGRVSFSSAGRRGTGSRAVYLSEARSISLFGDDQPAVVEDVPGGRRFEGPSLTIDMAADTIATGTSAGERGRIRFSETARDADQRQR